MAQKDYSDQWRKILNKAKKHVGSAFFLEDATILNVEIEKKVMTNAFRKATKAIFRGEGKVAQGKKYNQVQYWNEAFESISENVEAFEFRPFGMIKVKEPYYKKTGNASNPDRPMYEPNTGVHLVKANKTRMIFDIIIVSGETFSGRSATQAAERAMKFIKDSLWDEWVDIVSAKAGEQILGSSQAKGKRYSESKFKKQQRANKKGELQLNKPNPADGIIHNQTYSQLFSTGGVKAAHKVDSTKGVKGLEYLLKTGVPALTLNGVKLDMTNFVKLFLGKLQIRARNTRLAQKTDGKFPKQTHLIEVRIDTNKDEISDFGYIQKAAEEHIKNFIKGKIETGEIDLANQASSKPYTKELQDTAVRAFIKPLLKKKDGFRIKNTIDITPAKGHNYSITAGTVKKAGRKKQTSNLSFTAATLAKTASARPRSQSGKQEKTYSLAQIKAFVNRGLHNKIKQNMGRPALEYQTGQFARSVQLLSLRETTKTVQGNYTYQLDGGQGQQGVYSTFENSARWPVGYDPKPLIAKSIRELASKYTDQKFVLRRK